MANEITVRGPRSWVNDILLGDGINKSGTITMSLAPTKGDCYLKGGTVDVDAWTCEGGFILGIDDSDSDIAKFFVGNTASSYQSWNGTSMIYQIGSGDTLTVKGGGDIVLETGGDIILEPSDANPALIKWSTVHNLGAAATVVRGLCIWPTTPNQERFYIGYDPTDPGYSRYDIIGLHSYLAINLRSYRDASHYVYLDLNSGGVGSDYLSININGNVYNFWSTYLSTPGGIHIGGITDPGADNLVVDSLAGAGNRAVIADANGLLSAP